MPQSHGGGQYRRSHRQSCYRSTGLLKQDRRHSVFYRYRLVSRWLSVWGLIGITLTIITSVLVMLDVIPGFGTVQMIANGPIALQEMVFAVWLIAKGIDTTAMAVE